VNTTHSILQSAIRQLSCILHSSPRLEAELLLSHVLQKPRSYFTAWPKQILTVTEINSFSTLLQRRLQGEPIAYILGTWDFWNVSLQVTSDVLIPRPETEILVELVLATGDQYYQHMNCVPKMVDLGTGSGAIAAAIKVNRPSWQIYATDVSLKSLSVAQANFQRLGVSIPTFCGNWYEALPQSLHFDMIVSNPPYVAECDPHLQQGDVQQEPKLALVSGVNGTDALRILCNEAVNWLQFNGAIFLEHGYNQGNVVRTFLRDTGMQRVQTWRDLAGHERITRGIKTNENCYFVS
jgi:release factor glutamine methyltransferase